MSVLKRSSLLDRIDNLFLQFSELCDFVGFFYIIFYEKTYFVTILYRPI